MLRDARRVRLLIMNHSAATDDDGSCLYYAVGCAYSEACNYDSTADLDDGSCLFAEPGFDCFGRAIRGMSGQRGLRVRY